MKDDHRNCNKVEYWDSIEIHRVARDSRYRKLYTRIQALNSICGNWLTPL